MHPIAPTPPAIPNRSIGNASHLGSIAVVPDGSSDHMAGDLAAVGLADVEQPPPEVQTSPLAVGLRPTSWRCAPKRGNQVQPIAPTPPSVPNRTIGNALNLCTIAIVPDGSPNVDESVASSQTYSMPSLASLGTFLALGSDHKPRFPHEVQNLKQEIMDFLVTQTLSTDCSELLPVQWCAMKAVLSNVQSLVVELQDRFQLSHPDGESFDEARRLIHTVLGIAEYCEDAPNCLSTVCEARFWHEWEVLLGDLCVHGADGDIAFQATAQEAMQLTVAQVRAEIFQKRILRSSGSGCVLTTESWMMMMKVFDPFAM